MLKHACLVFLALAAVSGFAEGQSGKIPPFRLTTIDGQTLTDQSLRGKVVVLDFWATWCSPCRRVSKVMQSLQKRYGGKDVQIVCVDVKEQGPSLAAVRKYKAKDGYTYPFAIDKTLDSTLAVTELPTVIIVDRTGKIAFRTTGFHEGTTQTDIETHLKATIAK